YIYNREEASFVTRLLQICLSVIQNSDLVDKKSARQGILTPYNGQVQELRNQISKSLSFKERKQLSINTVDSFQGKELDVIIYSSVRASDEGSGFISKPSSIGFLCSKQRLNVA